MNFGNSNVLLSCESIRKSFYGVKVLHGVSMEVRSGEVHALCGENGAGKSTFVKILSGVHRRDDGIVRLAGEELTLTSPNDALHSGIVTIQQDQNMVLDLTVAENIVLGQESMRGPWIDRKENASRASEGLARIGANIDPNQRLGDLSIAQRQLVEIARALIYNAKVMIFDEPTASLGASEVEALFALIKSLREQQMGIIYISHRMPEIFKLADRITIFKDGSNVTTEEVKNVNPERVAAFMVGRDLGKKTFVNRSVGDTRFEVRNLIVQDRPPATFSVKSGEVLGIAGLVGAGRSTMVRGLFGAIPATGEIMLDGRRLSIRSPRQAIRSGIALLTEDRKQDGLLMEFPISINTTLATIKEMFPVFIKRKREQVVGEEFIRRLGIRAPSASFMVQNLSGGNQQKVVLAKWIQTDAKVLILDEPTKGVDVGAKDELYEAIRELAQSGIAVIVISSELTELLKLANRVLVMRNAQIVGELSHDEATEEAILALALGVTANEGSL